MRQIRKRFGLEDYRILSFSLYNKHKAPFAGIICKKNNKRYFIKKMLVNKSLSKSIIRKEFKILKQRYNKILNPQLLDDGILTNYITKPTLSYYMTQLFGFRHTKKAIHWLVKFHEEKHENGVGHIHGDFSFDDIIPTKKRDIVLDWEDYQENKEQLIDIYYLIFRTYMRNPKIKKDKEFKKMIYSFIGSNLHPYLKYYIKLRKIKFSRQRRIKALKGFLKLRLERQNKLYDIPTFENYIYRKVKLFLGLNL